MTFNLSLVGGRRYGTADGPLYINETYPLLISPSGTELLVGEGENGANLPFLSQSTIACVLTQIEQQKRSSHPAALCFCGRMNPCAFVAQASFP